MKKTLLLLVLFCISSVSIAFGQQATVPGATPQPQQTMLGSTGIAAGDALKVLPKGAVLHVQINNMERLAHDLNDLVVSAVPEKAIPPQMQTMMAQPKPLLAFLGMNTVGAPLSALIFSKMMGIDVTRPVTMTVFMDENAPAFVVSIPVADFVPLTGMTMNMTRPKSFEATTIGDAKCFRVIPGKPGMPREILIVCSDDHAFFCSSEKIAGQLASAPPAMRMTATDFIPSFVAGNGDGDAIVAVDTTVLKQFLPMLEKQFMTIPPPMVDKIRNAIPPDVRPAIASRLRSDYGFKSFDEALDYTEVFVLASYEILAKHVVTQVRSSQGAGFALDLGGKYQSLKVAVRSDEIKAEKATAPISVAELKKAIDKLPGQKRLVMASGKVPEKKPSAFAMEWADLVRKKMTVKEISSKKTDLFLSTICSVKPAQAVESISPWTVTTFTGGQELNLEVQESWNDLVRAASTSPFATLVKASIMPITGDVLKQYYVSEAKKAKQNLLAQQKLNSVLSERDPFLTTGLSLTSAVLDDDITRMTELKTYQTSVGFFGYDEHELVNRKFTLFREDGDLLCIEKGTKKPGWLAGEQFGKSSSTRESIGKLIDKAPDNVHTLHISTSDDIAANVLEFAGIMEDTVHGELKTYLLRVRKVLAAGDPQPATLDELASQMPAYVISVNKDVDTGKTYLVLPGNITYPRYKMVPVAAAGTVGGTAYYERTIPGQHEMMVLQNSEGLAMLIKSVVNSFYTRFMTTPEGSEKLGKLLQGPYGGPREMEVLFSNPAPSPVLQAIQNPIL